MAAAVRVEKDAFSEPRIELLGTLAGYNRFEALGRLTHLWSVCTDRETNVVSEAIVAATIGPGGVEALIGAELGERVEDGIRVRGTAGRTEWLAKKRAGSENGGKATAAHKAAKKEPSGSHDPAIGQPSGSHGEATTQTIGEPSGSPLSPSLPTPKEEKKEMSAVADRVLAHLSSKTGIRYRGAKKHVQLIMARLADGIPEADLIAVVDRQDRKWPRGDKFREFLRPETLFGPDNIAKYLDAAISERDLKPANAPPLPDAPPSNYDDYGATA